MAVEVEPPTAGNGKDTVEPIDADHLGYERDTVEVAGLEFCLMRRRSDFFAAAAGDLPIKSTGLVLWECGNLLADYLCYARWLGQAADSLPFWMVHPPCPVIPSKFWVGKSILELGGGCGLVTAALASYGARVVCTDGDTKALQTASRNCADARRRRKAQWGCVSFSDLPWGDDLAAQQVVRKYGPFDFVVGSDLLYGDKSPPGPLVKTLAAIAGEASGRGAEVIIALKNRCADESGSFCRAAEAKGLWDVCRAPAENLLEGFDGICGYEGAVPDSPAYSVIHLTAPSGQIRAAADVPDVGKSDDHSVPSPPKRPRLEVQETPS